MVFLKLSLSLALVCMVNAQGSSFDNVDVNEVGTLNPTNPQGQLSSFASAQSSSFLPQGSSFDNVNVNGVRTVGSANAQASKFDTVNIELVPTSPEGASQSFSSFMNSRNSIGSSSFNTVNQNTVGNTQGSFFDVNLNGGGPLGALGRAASQQDSSFDNVYSNGDARLDNMPDSSYDNAYLNGGAQLNNMRGEYNNMYMNGGRVLASNRFSVDRADTFDSVSSDAYDQRPFVRQGYVRQSVQVPTMQAVNVLRRFPTRSVGTTSILGSTNVVRRHLVPTLRQMRVVQPSNVQVVRRVPVSVLRNIQAVQNVHVRTVERVPFTGTVPVRRTGFINTLQKGFLPVVVSTQTHGTVRDLHNE